MEKKIKVMHMISEMNVGGAQRVVLNYLKYFKNDSDIELVLYVMGENKNSTMDLEIRNNRYNVRYLNYKSKPSKNILNKILELNKRYKLWNSAIKEFSPDIIHVHISSLLINVLRPILIYKPKVCFSTLHSNPYRYKGLKKYYIQYAFNMRGVIPVCLCEEQARKAEQQYKIIKYEIIRNGLWIDELRRNYVPNEVNCQIPGIEKGTFVISSVGRLNDVKNFTFLLEIFSEICKVKEDVKLILVGDGPEKNALQTYAKQLNVFDKVIFLGEISNVMSVYSVSNVFVMTSHSEGFSIVALEAQVNNLRCVISEAITSELIVTSNVTKLSLNESIDKWVEAILGNGDTELPLSKIENFDIQIICEELRRMYIKYNGNEN